METGRTPRGLQNLPTKCCKPFFVFDFLGYCLLLRRQFLHVCSVPVVADSATPRTVAYQAPLSVRCSRQGYQSGLSLPSPGHLPYPGIEPRSPAAPALAGGFFTTQPPGKPWSLSVRVKIRGCLGPPNLSVAPRVLRRSLPRRGVGH